MMGSLFITFVVERFLARRAWTFVFWGVLHGLFLICSMMTQKLRGGSVDSRSGSTSRRGCTTCCGSRSSSAWSASPTSCSRRAHERRLLHFHAPSHRLGSRLASVQGLPVRPLASSCFALYGDRGVMVADTLQRRATYRELLVAAPGMGPLGPLLRCAVSIILLGAFYDTHQNLHLLPVLIHGSRRSREPGVASVRGASRGCVVVRAAAVGKGLALLMAAAGS